MQSYLVPQHSAGTHSTIPRHMMKPQQKVLRTSIQVRKLIADRLMILANRIAAGRGAVESDSFGISTMVINRIPIIARLRIPPRSLTVVMAAPKKMVQSQRCHVIDHSFARLKHDSGNG